MKTLFKVTLTLAIIGSLSYAGIKGFQYYQARKLAKIL